MSHVEKEPIKAEVVNLSAVVVGSCLTETTEVNASANQEKSICRYLSVTLVLLCLVFLLFAVRRRTMVLLGVQCPPVAGQGSSYLPLRVDVCSSFLGERGSLKLQCQIISFERQPVCIMHHVHMNKLMPSRAMCLLGGDASNISPSQGKQMSLLRYID